MDTTREEQSQIADNHLAVLAGDNSEIKNPCTPCLHLWNNLTSGLTDNQAYKLGCYLGIFFLYVCYLVGLALTFNSQPNLLLVPPAVLEGYDEPFVPFSFFLWLAIRFTTISIPGFLPTHESGVAGSLLTTMFTPRHIWSFFPLSAIGVALCLYDMHNFCQARNVLFASALLGTAGSERPFRLPIAQTTGPERAICDPLGSHRPPRCSHVCVAAHHGVPLVHERRKRHPSVLVHQALRRVLRSRLSDRDSPSVDKPQCPRRVHCEQGTEPHVAQDRRRRGNWCTCPSKESATYYTNKGKAVCERMERSRTAPSASLVQRAKPVFLGDTLKRRVWALLSGKQHFLTRLIVTSAFWVPIKTRREQQGLHEFKSDSFRAPAGDRCLRGGGAAVGLAKCV